MVISKTKGLESEDPGPSSQFLVLLLVALEPSTSSIFFLLNPNCFMCSNGS